MSTEKVLSDLIQICLDDANRYKAAADHASLGPLRAFLEKQAKTRSFWASELQTKIAAMGGEPPTSGTIGGTVDRLAMDLNVDLAGDVVLVDWCEKESEKTAKRFEEALMSGLPESCRTIVEHQTNEIR